MVTDDAVMRTAMRLARTLGKPVMDHAVMAALAKNGVIRDCALARRLSLPIFPPEAETEALGVEEMMRTMVRSLPEREAQVLQGIYGINQDSAQTLREVGDALNISHERVRQLRDQALKRIRRQTTKTVLREKFEGYLEAVSN